MRNSKFYRSLLLTYIGIICVYTLIMIGLFFVGAKKYIGNRLDTQNELFLEQYAKGVDSNLDIAFNVSRQLFTSTEVHSFLLSKEVNYYNLVKIYRNIHQTISPFSRLNFYVALGKSNSDLIISASGTLKKESFYQKMNFPFSGDEEANQYFAKRNQETFPIIQARSDFYNISENLITFIETQRLLSKIEMIAYITYPEKGLFPDIAEWSKGALLIKHGESSFINRNYGLSDEMWREIQEKIENNQTLRDYSMYRYTINRGDLELFYIAKKPSFTEMWTEIMSEFGIIYLGLILFGAIAAFFITKKVYQPVLSVVSQYKQDYDLNNISDEFAVFRTASEKMNRNKEELEQIIRENKEPLKTKFLRDLLYGLSDEDAIEEKIAKYDLEGFKGPYRLLLIEHINYAKMDDQFTEENLGEIRGYILSLYKEVLSKEIERYEMVELEKKRVGIILLANDYGKVKETLEELLESLAGDYGIQVVAILTEETSKLENLDICYSAAIDQLVHRHLLPPNKIISEVQKVEVKPMAYYYPLDVEESLINYVDQRKEEETHLLLEHILNQNFKHHSMTPETLPLLTFAIIATINRLLNQHLKTVEDIYGEGVILYLELRTIVEPEEFKKKAHSLFQTLLEQLESDDHVEQEDSLASRLLEYIHANYQMDISLNDVADAFSITPTYVSMLFKKEYKTNFKDYLNRYKIEQAKEIMKNNKNIKNKELSEAVGFNSVNTFLRLFKKYTGETPGKYMEAKR